jgi:serine/threonine-protein kinase
LLPVGQQFTNAGRQLLSISPDGKKFVYVANTRLYVKDAAEKDARPLTDSSDGVTNPIFSPDGKFIAFWNGSDQSLNRVSIDGGTPQIICQSGNPFGMNWTADDQIVFGQGANGILRVKATGGTPETIVNVKSGELAHGPVMLPAGNSLLYTLASNTPGPAPGTIWDNAKIVVQSLKSDERKTLIEGGSDARYSPTGHIVYAVRGRLMSVAFDAARQEVTGKPVVLIDGVRNAGGNTGTTQFSFSDTGSLVYISAATAAQAQSQMAFVDLNGNIKPVRKVPSSIFGPRISPDAKRVAYRDGPAVWIADLSSEAPPRRLTTEPGEAPIWSPDGERIAYISIYDGREALFSRRSDGSGSPELLVDRARAPESWSAVNQAISFITLVGPAGDAGDYDISTYSWQTKKATPLIVIPPSAQSGSRFSPDGKWMAYESNESGRAEIYVEPYPSTGKRFQITKGGGARPLWAPDSSRLYFDSNALNPTQINYVNVLLQPEFTFTGPQSLPVTGFVQPSGTIRRQYDITPDGQQFLMTFALPAQQPQIEMVSNWFDQLRRR